MKPTILPYGTDARVTLCRDMLEACADTLPEGTVHLLPIPSTRDGIHVRDTDTPLRSLLTPGSHVVGYGLPASLTAAAEAVGARLCDVATDAAFTEENARLTAVGTLGYLLTHTVCAPAQLRVGIVGYGRIGRHLCRLLLFLGASVRIYTGKLSVRHTLGALGIDTCPTERGTVEPLSFAGLDVLINTAPAEGLISARCEALPPLLLELASGKNIPEDVPHVALPSLPARMYPRSAAAAYAHAACRALVGEG